MLSAVARTLLLDQAEREHLFRLADLPDAATINGPGSTAQAVPGTRMVVYRPADEITRTAIDELLAGQGIDEHFPCWEIHRQRAAELAVS